MEIQQIFNEIDTRNCKHTLDIQRDRVKHFKNRIKELDHSPQNVVIVLANVDTPDGEYIAEMTMPNHNWQQYRDNGEIPFARGLCDRSGIELFLHNFGYYDEEKILKECQGTGIVVIDHGTAKVFCE